MKALLFNSGLGSRLGDLTKDKPKALVKLSNGETVFERQIRLLSACGVKDFVVTTGPFADQIEAAARPFVERGCAFVFVANPLYAETNYIYSMYLADPFLRDDDFLLVHGDLVFDAAYVQAVLDADLPSLGSVDESAELPEKDFKARVEDGVIAEIGVGIFDLGCVAFQPFYKLSRESMATWLDSVGRFVEAGKVRVYAEDAANAVFGDMRVAAFPCDGHVVAEVDTPEDLRRVSEAVRLADFEQQPVFEAGDDGRLSLVEGFCPAPASEGADVAGLLHALGAKRPLVVSGSRFEGSRLRADLELAGVRFASFSGYGPNPSYEQVVAGVRAFKEAGCDSVVSVGGGSAVDVAKCVKMFAAMPGDGVESRFVDMPYRFSPVPHVAVPTTAGTGSESTGFAVVYLGGEKMHPARRALPGGRIVLVGSLFSAEQGACGRRDPLDHGGRWGLRGGGSRCVSSDDESGERIGEGHKLNDDDGSARYELQADVALRHPSRARGGSVHAFMLDDPVGAGLGRDARPATRDRGAGHGSRRCEGGGRARSLREADGDPESKRGLRRCLGRGSRFAR